MAVNSGFDCGAGHSSSLSVRNFWRGANVSRERACQWQTNVVRVPFPRFNGNVPKRWERERESVVHVFMITKFLYIWNLDNEQLLYPEIKKVWELFDSRFFLAFNFSISSSKEINVGERNSSIVCPFLIVPLLVIPWTCTRKIWIEILQRSLNEGRNSIFEINDRGFLYLKFRFENRVDRKYLK